MCLPPSRSLPRVLTRPTEEKIVRKYADTKRNGGPIRANVLRDKKEISSIPAFRSRTPRISRGASLVFVHASFPLFPAICRIFQFSKLPLSLSFSLSLSLVRVPAFLFPFDSYFLSLSLISFANFLADPISRNEREWTTRTYTRIRPRIVFDLLVLTYLVERATSELVSIGSIRASKNASRKSRHSRRGRDKETRIRPISSRQEITFFPSRVKLKENGSPLFRFQRFINYSRSSRILFFQEYIFFLHPRV